MLEGLILGAHLATFHVGPDAGELNSFNPGVYISSQETGWTAGYYHNSIRHGSFYVGKTFRLSQHWDITLGGVTGYYKMPVAPLIVPSYRIGLDELDPSLRGVNLRIGILPKPRTHGSGGLHLSVEKKW